MQKEYQAALTKAVSDAQVIPCIGRKYDAYSWNDPHIRSCSGILANMQALLHRHRLHSTIQ